MAEIGFKIHGKMYPLIVPDDWTVNETRLARKVAGDPLGRLIQKGDHYMINVAYAAAAWWRANPLASEEDAENAVGALTAKDIEFVGGQGSDDSPPDGTLSEDSSVNTGASSEENPAASVPTSSGTSESATGGLESGPPTTSES
ncbi:MAG TPA: hypothetical protein VFH56_13915 [Acidimicrobiales bacterium]|nr:hypothetical protein [Acidimicrobiales bacterium]